MKQRKWLALLLCAVMLLAFAGCNDQGAVEDEPVVDVSPEETPEVPEADPDWEAIVENKISADAAYQVLGADGEAYENYTFYAAPLHVEGEPDLTYIVENCVACRTIESAEPQAVELEPGVYAIAVVDNANPENLEIRTIWVKESDGADMLTIETDWEVMSEPAVTVTDAVFEHQFEDGMESAVIRGYDAAGVVVWTYETEKYEAAQLDRVSEIGRNGDRFYFVEDGAVVALNLSDGSVLWTNDEFMGSGDYTFGDDGTVYLCGYFGPDFMAIDPDGKTLCYIDCFYPEYYWAYGIEYLGDQVAVTMEMPSDETVYVNLADYTYSLSAKSEAEQEEPKEEPKAETPDKAGAAQILSDWYAGTYDKTNLEIAVLADVTHDGNAELITVHHDAETTLIEGYVYTTAQSGEVSLLETISGAESHAGGFFGWYLKKAETGYDLIQENFGMWQGYGEVGLTEYYLGADGSRVVVQSAGAASEGDAPVTEEAWEQYMEDGGALLKGASLLYKSASEITADLAPLDESLLLQ